MNMIVLINHSYKHHCSDRRTPRYTDSICKPHQGNAKRNRYVTILFLLRKTAHYLTVSTNALHLFKTNSQTKESVNIIMRKSSKNAKS